MSNHYILNRLESKSAWIYTPSRPDERNLGYDASLQNYKATMVQYKKVTRINTSDQGISITLNYDQHLCLIKNFPPVGLPYVFYCFSGYQSYRMIDLHYINMGSPAFFYFSLFFDVHAFPSHVTSLRLFGDGRLRAYLGSGNYSSRIRYYCGPTWVDGIKHCKIGSPIQQLGEYIDAYGSTDSLPPRLNYIYVPMSDIIDE